MTEEVSTLRGARALNGEELGTVLASLGPVGDQRDRLAAVVALLANQDGDTNGMVRGAFAGATAPMRVEAKVRGAFTSALHGCLRDQPVNAASPATTRSV